MRRIALAVLFSSVFATHVAFASDPIAPADKAKDSTATDAPKAASAPDVAKDSDALAPPLKLEAPTGSPAGVAVLRSLHVGLALSQAYDIYSTQRALGRGAVEVNPLMQNTVASRVAFIGLKVAMTAGPIYEAEHLWRTHHRVGAVALMAAANGIMMAVAAHNAVIMDHAVSVR
jgi:hypothetical protein